MLSAENNRLISQVGPGTAMGEWLRRFWLPALLEEEVPEPDCPPVEVTLLGEQFVAFRDTAGRLGVLDAHCPHRCAPLLLGRNEEGGLRCVYHGWKFDVDGRCLDMPNEPATSTFRHRVRARAYPTRVAGRMVWVYLGPPDRQPSAIPELEWTTLDAEHVVASKRLQTTNWVQSVEGGIDSSHISFLHREWAPGGDPAGGGQLKPITANPGEAESNAMSAIVADGAPAFRVRSADFGLFIGARRGRDRAAYYWRITPFLLPCYTVIPPTTDASAEQTSFNGHAWVPIDDEHTWVYNITWRAAVPFTAAEVAAMRSTEGTHGDEVDAAYRPLATRANLWNLDRKRQRTTSFTGIVNAGVQDRAVQEGMGAVVDRTREHLGTSDTAIIAFRRLLLRSARQLRDGVEPPSASKPETYLVRSASVYLNEPEDFVSAAGDAFTVSRRPAPGLDDNQRLGPDDPTTGA